MTFGASDVRSSRTHIFAVPEKKAWAGKTKMISDFHI